MDSGVTRIPMWRSRFGSTSLRSIPVLHQVTRSNFAPSYSSWSSHAAIQVATNSNTFSNQTSFSPTKSKP